MEKTKKIRPRRMRFAAQVYIANLLRDEKFQREVAATFPDHIDNDDVRAFVGEFNRIANRISESITLGGGVMDAVETVLQNREGSED